VRGRDDYKERNGKDMEGGVFVEQVTSFNYLGYTITVTNNRDLEIKINRSNQMCSTIGRTLNNTI
jgi:hypothetical protein